MSWRIYNAYLWKKENITFSDILERGHKIRKLIENTYIDNFTTPEAIKTNKKFKTTELLDIVSEMLKDLCIVVYQHESKVIFHLMGLHSSITRVFANLPWEEVPIDAMKTFGDFIDYHYQDSADPYYCFEEHTAEEIEKLECEYEERCNTWHSIFSDVSTPATAGAIIQLDTQDTISSITFKVREKYSSQSMETTSVKTSTP